MKYTFLFNFALINILLVAINVTINAIVVKIYINWLSLSFSIVSMMTITTIMAVSMTIVSWFSYSLPLSIVSMMSITAIMACLSLSLSIVSMMTITTRV